MHAVFEAVVGTHTHMLQTTEKKQKKVFEYVLPKHFARGYQGHVIGRTDGVRAHCPGLGC